jgi:hypothetical protein
LIDVAHRIASRPSVDASISLNPYCNTCHGLRACNLSLSDYLHTCRRQAARIEATKEVRA